jgi:hypothetical protein
VVLKQLLISIILRLEYLWVQLDQNQAAKEILITISQLEDRQTFPAK